MEVSMDHWWSTKNLDNFECSLITADEGGRIKLEFGGGGFYLFLIEHAVKRKKKRITQYFLIDINLDLVTAFHVFGI